MSRIKKLKNLIKLAHFYPEDSSLDAKHEPKKELH